MPYFFQLKSLLTEALDAGRWEPGDQIPSEPELCERYGVSRATVRQALSELEREGRVRKERGRGTFVSEPRSNAWFVGSAQGFFDEATVAGRRVDSKVLRQEVVELPAWSATALGLPVGSPGLLLERLRAVDDEIVMYVESYLRPDLAELVLGARLEEGSLYQLLRDGAGIDLGGGRRIVEAKTAHDELASLLEIEPGSALLHVEAVSLDDDGRAFEAYRAWHRSDRTKIVVQVAADDPAPFGSEGPA